MDKDDKDENPNKNENLINDRETIDSNTHLIQFTEDNPFNIDNKKRITIFIILSIVAILSSLDGGIIPQQNEIIKADFGGDGEERVGLFGSIDYIGRVFGSFIFTSIMGRINRKMILVVSLFFKTVTMAIPIITKNYEFNIVARCLSGISQVFYPTYLPVWCDQYAKKKLKAIWVTIVQIGNPIGIILGYGLGMLSQVIFSGSTWAYCFLIEGILLAICAVIIIFFDNIYFSEKFVLVDDSKGKEVRGDKTFKLFRNLRQIMCNPIFLFSSLCNSVAFFGIGVVQYYGDKYMDKVLEIGGSIRFILFGLVCLLGPTSGMVFGGIICSKLGGYINRKSMTFVLISMAVASAVSMCIACHNINGLFVAAGWIYLFGIGAVVPPISGIIISCLEQNLRGDGFSICNCFNNLIGSFPSSYVFSLLVDAFSQKDEKDRYKYAWMISMCYNFVGLIYVIIAGIFRYRIKGDLSETDAEKNKKIESESGSVSENM